MGASSIALQGLQQSEIQLAAAASSIATAGTTSANGSNFNLSNLSTDIVSLVTAEAQFSLNLASLKTADEVEQNLIDVLA
jgi:hypothetical protein